MGGKVVDEERNTQLPVRWQSEFERYQKQGYNLLVPREIGETPPHYRPQMAIVQVNPEKDSGEVYQLPGGKWALSKVSLDRIAQAANITWVPELSGRTDDGSNPRRIQYRSVGKVKGIDGQWRTIIGEYVFDLDVAAEELNQSLPKRWERMERKPQSGFKTWFEKTHAEDLLQFRKHAYSRAESGAKNRAIRSAFGIKSGYTAEALRQPFVIPKVLLVLDYSDPEVKKFLLAEATGTIKELYGAQAVATGTMPPALPPVKDEDEEPETAATDEPIRDAVIEPPTTEDRSAEPKLETSDQPIPDSDAVKFQEADGDAKKECEALTRLIARKGYQTEKLKRPLAEFSKQERAGFLKHLLSMKDVQPPEFPWK